MNEGFGKDFNSMKGSRTFSESLDSENLNVPCPSFPWLFGFYLGKPPNLPRIFCPCHPQNPWKRQRKH